MPKSVILNMCFSPPPPPQIHALYEWLLTCLHSLEVWVSLLSILMEIGLLMLCAAPYNVLVHALVTKHP